METGVPALAFLALGGVAQPRLRLAEAAQQVLVARAQRVPCRLQATDRAALRRCRCSDQVFQFRADRFRLRAHFSIARTTLRTFRIELAEHAVDRRAEQVPLRLIARASPGRPPRPARPP